MSIFEQMAKDGHEQVIFCYDRGSGLRAIIAIHDTTLGPALGGCRMLPYATESEAVTDALRLSKGMTYKCAATGVNHGGGKAVIWGDPQQDKSEELFRALGRYMQTLGGRYYTGTDMGTEKEDFVYSRMESRYIVGLPEEHGGSGNSAIITAYGVWRGMKAAALEVFGNDSLTGRHVAIQGLGKVGYHLVERLVEEGARLTVTDVSPENVRRVAQAFDVEVVDPDAIYGVPCDIFAPCAVGAVLNDETIPRLNCRIVAGSANNQLAEPRHGAALFGRAILYCPDYVINAGGLIQVADELMGYDRDRAFQKASTIYEMLRRIFAISAEEQIPTSQAADRHAERRIASIGRLSRIYLPE